MGVLRLALIVWPLPVGHVGGDVCSAPAVKEKAVPSPESGKLARAIRRLQAPPGEARAKAHDRTVVLLGGEAHRAHWGLWRGGESADSDPECSYLSSVFA